MVYKFRLSNSEVKDFSMDIIINPKNNFLQFHIFLQNILNFDSQQMASFFLVNSEWERIQEITLINMADDDQAYTMEDEVVGDYINPLNKNLIYVFDYFSDRFINIELLESLDESYDDTPEVLSQKGLPPNQNTDEMNQLLDF